MNAIEKLREWAQKFGPMGSHDPLMLADEIEAEIAANYLLLPVDRNGETIRIGDEVWFHDEPDADPHIVRGYGMTNGRDVDVFINHADEGWCPNTVTVPDVLVHRRPDPLKELLYEFAGNYADSSGPGYDEECVERYAERIRDMLGGAE